MTISASLIDLALLALRSSVQMSIEKVMQAHGVEGARIVLSGRLGGDEIARTEELKRGSIPLQTFRADIDFKRERATLSYGVVGIKVWIYRGKIFADKKSVRDEKGANTLEDKKKTD